MIYYAIRHKKTGKLMPQARRDRGYSHWNPDTKEGEMFSSIGVPRLIDTRRKAAKCIEMWVALPNGKRSIITSYHGEQDDIVDFKPDGRKKDDLEIIEVYLQMGEKHGRRL